jgi:hypothetical protein
MIDIYDIQGNVLMQAELTSSAKREEELSKSDYISLSWSSSVKVILPVGAYINHTYKIDKTREVTRQFLLLESYEPTQSDEMTWKYTPEFQHPKMVLSKIPFYVLTKNSQNEEIKQHIWSFVGTMSTMAAKLANFLNNEIIFGNAGWTVQYDESNSNTINVSFSDNDFISSLTAIVNAIGDNCEWHIDYDNEIIYIGKISIDNGEITLKVGDNVGVPSITDSKESYYNSYAIFGGTRNITQVNSKGENISSSDIRLQLSEGTGTTEIDGKTVSYTIDKYSTLDLRQDKTKEPQFTKVLDFSQIFPSLNTYVYNVRGRQKYVLDDSNKKVPLTYNSDGSVAVYKTFTVWYMRLAYPVTEKIDGKNIVNTTTDDGVTYYWYDFEITDDLLVDGKTLSCSFEANFNEGALSTPLAGRGSNDSYVGFELTYHEKAELSYSSDDVSKESFSILAGDYEIIYQEDNNLIIPTNADEMIVPKGEILPSLKCNITVLYNIAMADSIYIKDAQQRLLDKAIEEIQRLQSDLNNYTTKSYPHVFLESNPCLQIGQKVIYNDGHGYTLSTRVLKLSTNIDYDFVQEITVGNQAIKGTITELKESVESIIASGGGSSNSGGSYTESQLKNIISKYGTSYFLSKQFSDTAQGLITFAQGLIATMTAQLNGGATFGNNGYAFDKDGNVVVNAINSLAFDEALQKGFGITKDATTGKYTLSVTDLMVWGKAVFNSLEIRKLYSVGGNVYLSGASSKIQYVSEIKGTDGTVTGWKCYILADDGTTATQNGWVKYDQAKCQTFDIQEGTYEGVSNTFYWRLVTDVSTENEAITETTTDTDGNETTTTLYDGKKFGWIVLSATDCEATTNDTPKAGDTIVLDGHRIFAEGDAQGRDQYNDASRTNVMMLETTGTGNLPRIVALTNITDYKHSEGGNAYSNTVFILSPAEVVFVSSAIKWISASGDAVTMVNFRGAWVEGTSYSYYDQVSHNNSIWTCIVAKGSTTTLEPTADNSSVWRMEITATGDKGEDAVTYEVQVASYSEWVNSSRVYGLQFQFVKVTGATRQTVTDVREIGCMIKITTPAYIYTDAAKYINGGKSSFLFSAYPVNNTTMDAADNITVKMSLQSDTDFENPVAVANFANGKQGKSALEISVSPDTLTFDTNDNGLVETADQNAAITCTRGGSDVTGKCKFEIIGTLNCTATISVNTVTITGITSQPINGQTVSNTNGYVNVKVTDEEGVAHTVTVRFTVNVAKFNSSMVANNKKLQTQYSELTNNGSITDLTEYKSEILQTARNISLKVQEKNVGRRNMLTGSAFRKQEDGIFKIMGGFISINNGFEGTNCVHAVNTYSGSQNYGVFWDGSQGGSSVKIDRTKKYVLSCWVKSDRTDVDIYLETVFTDKQTSASRVGKRPMISQTKFGTTAASTWELIEAVIDPSLFDDGTTKNTQYEYMAVNVFCTHTLSGVTCHTYICRPMLEEGDEYNGWTQSEQDYDYVGGNLLDNTAKLIKTDANNISTISGTVTQGGYGESAVLSESLSVGEYYSDILSFSTSGMGLKAGEDYILSFYAKASTEASAGKLQCYFYPSASGTNTEDSTGTDNIRNIEDGSLLYGIVPTASWKRYWVHWRPTANDQTTVLFRLWRSGTERGSYSSTETYAVDDVVLYNGTYWRCKAASKGNTPSSSSSYWEATIYDVSIAQPKLEVGATMTEWTTKRADMVDKQALLATGIDIENKLVTITADKFKVQNNSGDQTALVDETGKLTTSLIDADTVVANGIKTQKLEAQNLTVTGNSKFGIWSIGTDDTWGDVIQAKNFTDASGTPYEGSMTQYSPSFVRGGSRASAYMRVGPYTAEFGQYGDSAYNGVWFGYAARIVCQGSTNSWDLPTSYQYNSAYSPTAYIYSGGKGENPALAINRPNGGTALQTNGAVRCKGFGGGVVTVSGSTTLDNNAYFVRCTNSSAITVTLPSSPVEGQTVIMVQAGSGTVTISGGGKTIWARGKTSGQSTVSSAMVGQFCIFIYDGTRWNATLINNSF